MHGSDREQIEVRDLLSKMHDGEGSDSSLAPRDHDGGFGR